LPGGGVRWQLPLPGQAFYPVPVETLMFLFTDIEGSRPLLRRLGEGVYAQALAGHHALMSMRAASPSSRAWRPRLNWLVRAASVIGGPAGSAAWALPRRSRLAEGKSPARTRAVPYATAAATMVGSSSAIRARARTRRRQHARGMLNLRLGGVRPEGPFPGLLARSVILVGVRGARGAEGKPIWG